MSVSELYDWYAYYNDEPFFADRIEIQLATISLMIRSFGGGKGKKPTHDDFMIRRKEKPILSEEEKNNALINAFKSL